jgi:hypothetical protein
MLMCWSLNEIGYIRLSQVNEQRHCLVYIGVINVYLFEFYGSILPGHFGGTIETIKIVSRGVFLNPQRCLDRGDLSKSLTWLET